MAARAVDIDNLRDEDKEDKEVATTLFQQHPQRKTLKRHLISDSTRNLIDLISMQRSCVMMKLFVKCTFEVLCQNQKQTASTEIAMSILSETHAS